MNDGMMRYRIHYANVDGAIVRVMDVAIDIGVIALGHELPAVCTAALKNVPVYKKELRSGARLRVARVDRQRGDGAWECGVRWHVQAPAHCCNDAASFAPPRMWP